MFFELCRPPIKPLPGQEPATPPKPPMLRLRKLKMRCHFQVIEMQGTPITPGEVQALTGHDNFKKLQERWQAQIKKNMKDPRVDLPAEDSEGGPLVNLLVNRCEAVRADRLDSLKKRNEVTSRAANKRFPEEDLERALLITNNNDGDSNHHDENFSANHRHHRHHRHSCHWLRRRRRQSPHRSDSRRFVCIQQGWSM